MADKETEEYHISDEVWKQIEPLLPPEFHCSIDDHSLMDSRRAMEAILYMLHTDCEWDEIPASLGSEEKVYNRFQEWRRTGAFERMWQVGILAYDELKKLVSA